MRVMARLVKSLGFDGSFCILRVSERAMIRDKGGGVKLTLESRDLPLPCIRHSGSVWCQSAQSSKWTVSEDSLLVPLFF